DAFGNIVKKQLFAVNVSSQTATDTGHTTTYIYDSLNRLVKQTDPLPANPLPGQTEDQPIHTFTYDAVGNQQSLTTTAAAGGAAEQTAILYDGLNRIVQETLPDSTITVNTYDYVGNLRFVDRPGSEGQPHQITEFQYDHLNRVKLEIMPDPGHSQLQP